MHNAFPNSRLVLVQKPQPRTMEGTVLRGGLAGLLRRGQNQLFLRHRCDQADSRFDGDGRANNLDGET
jgi:hypothetical protein